MTQQQTIKSFAKRDPDNSFMNVNTENGHGYPYVFSFDPIASLYLMHLFFLVALSVNKFSILTIWSGFPPVPNI